MTTYRDAVRRLTIVYNECHPDSKDKRDTDKELDGFTRLKKMIHLDVKSTRQMLRDREELLAVKPGSKDAAELSARIRSKLKTLREDSLKLQTINKQEEKKKKTSQDNLKTQEEVVSLVFKHIEELESIEKKRFNDKLATDRSALFAGAAPVKIDFTSFPGKPGTSASAGHDGELPDIDTDPETARELLLLQQGNRDIDTDLNIISNQAQQLKEIAINMDRELDKQNKMLEIIDTKVDKAQMHIDNVNIKMKQALDNVMKGDKFIVNCVLICVLLGLSCFIANYFVQ